MADITNFEFIGSDKTVSMIEVSLDGGATYGVLWSKAPAAIKSRNLVVTPNIIKESGNTYGRYTLTYDGPEVDLNGFYDGGLSIVSLSINWANCNGSYTIVDNYNIDIEIENDMGSGVETAYFEIYLPSISGYKGASYMDTIEILPYGSSGGSDDVEDTYYIITNVENLSPSDAYVTKGSDTEYTIHASPYSDVSFNIYVGFVDGSGNSLGGSTNYVSFSFGALGTDFTETRTFVVHNNQTQQEGPVEITFNCVAR